MRLIQNIRLIIPVSFKAINDLKLRKSLKKGTRYLGANHLFSKNISSLTDFKNVAECWCPARTFFLIATKAGFDFNIGQRIGS